MPPDAERDPAARSQHFIIGTAGHVDHGKTSLIRALTGAETDRLREEQERGMSIDLGFADFTLPSGRHAGVIDVPGHERFLKNMLAGAGGIDLVLLVIAADEGVMPQTREHLDILSILQTRRGVVALTKADLVDEEWLELVQDDIRTALKGSFLAGSPIVPVSSTTGQGVAELARLLDDLAEEAPTRTIIGPWRLPIDRVFPIAGFGTVVTGTLIAGVARVGDRVEILPSGREARVRGLQVHGKSAEMAEAGSRVAINLAGVDFAQVTRGDVAAPPGAYAATQAFDARLDVLPNAPRELRHRTRVRVYIGTAEVLGRLHLLDAETLKPGDSGLVQLRLESPIVASKGDRYVLRLYSPLETLGGGAVIDPQAARHRRRDAAVLANLAVRERGTPGELVAEAISRAGLTPVAGSLLSRELGIPPAELEGLLKELEGSGEIVRQEAESWLHAHRLEGAEKLALGTVAAYHSAHPMRAGMSREELRSRLSRQLGSRGFQRVMARLEQSGALVAQGATVRLAEHTARLTAEQEAVANALCRGLLADPFNPPGYEELCAGARLSPRQAQEIWEALIANGTVIRIAADVFLHEDAFAAAVAKVRAFLSDGRQMTAGEFRDLLGTSRKYAVPLLEALDARKVTRRLGDTRELIR